MATSTGERDRTSSMTARISTLDAIHDDSDRRETLDEVVRRWRVTVEQYRRIPEDVREQYVPDESDLRRELGLED